MEKIISNHDVLQSIFRYLDFEEHLKLIKICPQFDYAIVHGVWRSMCKNLRISRFTELDAVILQYNAENNVKTERSLTPEAIHIILHSSSMYIRKLELKNVSRLKDIISLKYHHLTELSLWGIFVKDTHLQQVAENCLNLQSLSLKNFTKFMYQSNIRPNIFAEMKMLNKLKIDDPCCKTWNYFDVHQLFCLVHLKTLNININIRDRNDNNGSNDLSTDRVYNIENLTIGLQSWNVFLIEYLIHFKNLTKISLILDGQSIGDAFLTRVNNACPKLCELSFIGCYLEVKEFPHMNNLMHLTFEWCGDMKFKDFDDIFRKHKLKSLSFVGGIVTDEPKDISDYNFISNTLETLNIQNISGRNLVRAFFNRQHKFENVSNVRIETNRFARKRSIGLCVSHNFPYLQELIMDSYYIFIEDILYLKHLKVLQFDLFHNMCWSYLKTLFNHPTLTHITITPFYCRDVEEYCERVPKSCEGLTTKLEYLSLPSTVYERCLNFWPCFRQRNKLLKLEIVDCDTLKSSMDEAQCCKIGILKWY